LAADFRAASASPSFLTTRVGGCFASSAARAAKDALLCCAVGPSSQVTFSAWRALFANHQLSATIATPSTNPFGSGPPSTSNA
jgi:hypothetical protein